ncbi:MAG: DUF2279 domain-containing protein [Smithella sp.]|nr:DUF2279 domain-containing protein [Smithella sp.]
MKRFLKNLSLQLFIFFISFFFTVHVSWATPDDSSSLGHDQSSVSNTQASTEKDGSVKPEQTDPAQTKAGREISVVPEQKNPAERKDFFTRGQKTLLLNAGSWAFILIYGLAEWDYSESGFHFENEHWFGRKTEYGGLDKLSHAWSSYAMSHFFSYVYRKWEYTDKEANLYGALSSLGVNTFMEIADGFSPSQGFSYEDMVMNIVGCGLGYVLGAYPDLARKVDFRMEITPKFDAEDLKIGTNYERQTYLLVAKADGFDFIENPYLKYLEFHLGYNAHDYKGYDEDGPDHRHRHIYAGLGFNVSKLLQKYAKTKVLDYIQIPYTSVRYGFSPD